MRRSFMKCVLILSGALILGLVAGCATSPIIQREKMLSQSGFKVVPAVSVAQREQIKTLPPNQVSGVKRNGKVYYVFPDHARNVLYVGNKAQFHTYQMALQNQQLTEDAKLMREAQESPRVADDVAVASGGVGLGWGQVWGEWPEDGD